MAAKTAKIEATGVLSENDALIEGAKIKKVHSINEYPELPIIWSTVYKHIGAHLISLYGLYLLFTAAQWKTVLLLLVNYEFGVLGATAGVHRLWSHRCYKARFPLRVFLAYCQASLFHMDIAFWSRYHRLHHKYTETDIDPHNIKRGFFFAHMGWTFRKTSPHFDEKYKTVDISDLYQDPVVVYQEKYYYQIMLLSCYIIPTVIPMYFWSETFVNAFCLNMLRYNLNLHTFFFVNSITHMFGSKPYDKSIEATEHWFVSYTLGGEGYHNYHHVFPWDYKASEFGNCLSNSSSAFIYFMSKIGMAYDLKTVSPKFIESRIKKTGDGTHEIFGISEENVRLLNRAM